MNENSKKNLGIQAAIKKAGGQIRLAELCGVTQPAVHHWLHNSCPAERAAAISRVTGVDLFLIRPDLKSSDTSTDAE